MSRVLSGKIVSDKMDKTVVVAVERLKTHPLYKKQYKTTAKFKAHDENNEYKVGDVVEITETRPLSKTKKFTITKKTGEVIVKGGKA
jgi:small subunit ribosomal protein S17